MRDIKNTIVVMFDSLQFNYLGCYGNKWIKTPNLDRFAREGILFENAYGNNMPTQPSRRSMMTGRFTLNDTGWGPLRPEDTTIADLCWGTGVDTAMAYNSPVLFENKAGFARGYARTTFSRGFDHHHFCKDELYDHYSVDQFLSDPGYLDRIRALPDGELMEKLNRNQYSLYLRDKQNWKKDDDHTVAVNIHEAIRLLETADRTHGLHLWIDNWDPHEPWDPPSVWNPDMDCPYDPGYAGADIWLPIMDKVNGLYTEEQMRHIRMLYAEKVSLCDRYFGQLYDCLRRLGMLENTLIWVTGDHGEPMGNGEHGHGLMSKCRPWPYEELVHIPLIIRAPGLPANKRITSFVQDCDCAPTLLDWMGLPIPPEMTGASLLPLMRGEVDKVRDFAVAGFYKFSWSIITEDWSLIHWLDKQDKQNASQALSSLYKGKLNVEQSSAAANGGMSAEEENAAAHQRDGEAQWTCTVGAMVELGKGDELYDRRQDPFQLNNIIEEHPDVALRLLDELSCFMEELKTR